MNGPSPGWFYAAKFLEAAGIGTVAIAIVVAMTSPDLSPYGRILPVGGLLFAAGWLLERAIGSRPPNP